MQRIGKYEILSELGQGGMGKVYKARDTFIGRIVAIKVIQERGLDIPDIKKRFNREARSVGQLSHEAITTLFDAGEEDGRLYLVMEYLEGSDLDEVLLSGKQLSLEEKLRIVLQVCEGLDYAHSKGVIHRDIKPSNVRLLPNGRVKIMDFGIARVLSDTQVLTRTNTKLGTPHYMSPEQVNDDPVDKRTDIFSFGILFYELLMGLNPFKASRLSSVFYKVLMFDPPPVEIASTHLSEALQPIVAKCLAKEPDQRYQSFGEVIRALHPLQHRLDETVLMRRPIEEHALKTGEAVADDTVVERHNVDEPLPQPKATPEPKKSTLPEQLPQRKQVGKKAKPQVVAQPPFRKGWYAVLGVLLIVLLATGSYFAFWKELPGKKGEGPPALPPPVVTTGSLFVDSTPKGARILLNDNPEGTTPQIISDVEAASHQLELQLEDHEAYAALVDVVAEETLRVNASMVPLPPVITTGSLSIASTPPGAQILIDDVPRGIAPRRVPGIEAGTHRLELRLEGYDVYETSVEVVAEETRQVTASLVQRLGVLRVAVIPWGRLLVDGEEQQAEVTTMASFEVPAGSRWVTIEHPSHGTWEREVRIAPDTPQQFLVDFTQTVRLTVVAVDEGGTPIRGEIYVDDERKGTTPRAIDVRVGLRKIEVRKEGYVLEENHFNVESDRTEPLQIILKKEGL